MIGNTKIGSCCGSRRSGCRDYDEQTTSDVTMASSSYLHDIMTLGNYLVKRYRPKNLMNEARGFYYTNLTQFKDDLGQTIDKIDRDVQ